MLKNLRHEKMIDLLSKETIMRVADLSEILGSSMMTIRRDLDQLEENNIVKRVHGGVLLTKSDVNQPSFNERIEEFGEEKKRIGVEAAKRIHDNDIVFFDAGTTTLAIVENIPNNLRFTAITTGLLTAVALSKFPYANVINVGGSVHKSSFSSMSSLAVDTIKSFHANTAFISTKAFSYPTGTLEVEIPLIEVKNAMVNSSDTVILIADHSKFACKSLCHAVSLDDIDEIISDDKLSNDIKNKLISSGKKVTLV